MKVNKSVYWSLKITLFITGIIALFQIVPHFMTMISALVILIGEGINTTPEFRFLLICLGIWVTAKVMDVIVNLIFKLQSMLELTQKGGSK